MKFVARTALMALLPLGFAACGDSESNPGLDAGGGGGLDASTPDAERPRSLCPVFENPSCTTQAACVEQSSFGNGQFTEVSEDCDFCPPFSGTVCTFGECELREDLSETDLLFDTGLTAQVPTGGLFARISVLVGIAIQAETAGGEMASCDEVRAGNFDFRNACVNIVDVRTVPNGGGSETFAVTFNRIPADRDTLFVVYGFENPDASEEPIGVYCTKQAVPAPTGQAFEIDSEPNFAFMQPL